MSPNQRFIARITAGIFATLLSLAAAPALPAGNGAPPEQTAAANSAQALSVYNEGKLSYDAGDYTAALHAFTKAAQLEPDNARWHYNIGLAQRQLERFQAAREAFLAARQKDPEYKRSEIDDKLVSMGFDPGGKPGRSRAAQDDDGGSAIGFVAISGFFILVILAIGATLFIRKKITGSAANPLKQNMAQLEALRQRLAEISPPLVSAEHALRLAEDRDLRALLDRATQLEHSAYKILDDARKGKASSLAAAARQIDEVKPLADQIQTRVAAIGPAAIAEAGHNGGESSNRSGCFFCARPLANNEYRRLVPLRSQQGNADVLACPPCAGLVAQGKTPRTTMLGDKNDLRHWSEDPDFDPYLNRHIPHPSARQIPAWQQPPTRSFSDLALLAAGGALGAGAAYAATRPLDLDTASQTDLAQEAALAAAKSAGSSSRDSSSRDFS